MHPKTLQKMINSNNTTNNNITINNNIKYVEFGYEKLGNVFSKKEKMDILTASGSAITNLIIYTHLNDKFPQFQNIIITNLKANNAYVYDHKLDKFILCDKTELLEELIIYRFDDLKFFYEQYKYNLSDKIRTTLEKTFLIKSDDTYNKLLCKDLNVIFFIINVIKIILNINHLKIV